MVGYADRNIQLTRNSIMPGLPSDSSETLALLRKARAGDRDAFDALFVRHLAALKRFVSLRMDTRVRARMDASDIVQETHIEAFRRFNDYYDRKPMPFDVWLRKNAFDRLRNARRDHVDAQRRSVERELRMPDPSSLLIAGKLDGRFATPSECASREEYRQRVSLTVDELSAPDRDVLLMRTVEGRTHREIAYLLDIDPATARKRYARALRRLEKLLIRNGLNDWNS